jgi:hypothetical protein
VASVVLVMSVVLNYKHLTVMPFHNPIENFVRGGIYFAVGQRRRRRRRRRLCFVWGQGVLRLGASVHGGGG